MPPAGLLNEAVQPNPTCAWKQFACLGFSLSRVLRLRNLVHFPSDQHLQSEEVKKLENRGVKVSFLCL